MKTTTSGKKASNKGAQKRTTQKRTAQSRTASAQKTTASSRGKRQGISNREPAEVEARERAEFPPVRPEDSAPASDAAGRVGDPSVVGSADGQTSHKAGSRSVAQKEGNTRYPDRSMPPTRKVAGAFGEE